MESEELDFKFCNSKSIELFGADFMNIQEELPGISLLNKPNFIPLTKVN